MSVDNKSVPSGRLDSKNKVRKPSANLSEQRRTSSATITERKLSDPRPERPKTSVVLPSSGNTKKKDYGDAPVTKRKSQVVQQETTKKKEFEQDEPHKNIQLLEQKSNNLKHILSNLHRFVTGDIEDKDISFELSGEMDTDSPENSESQLAVAILKKIKEMEGININLEAKVVELNDYRTQEASRIASYNMELSQLNRQSEMQKLRISELQQEKDTLLNRLSKVAGDRMTHDNTNITDLSDADRPTKLAEAFSEIYDNEWTDAFEELAMRLPFQGKEAITFLLDILMTSFQKCKEITWDRYQTLRTVASTIDVLDRTSACFRARIVEDDKMVSEADHPMDLETCVDQIRVDAIKEEEAREVTQTMNMKELDTNEDHKSHEETEQSEEKDVVRTLEMTNNGCKMRKEDIQEEAREVTQTMNMKELDTNEDHKSHEETEQSEEKDVVRTLEMTNNEDQMTKEDLQLDQTRDSLEEAIINVPNTLETILSSTDNVPDDRDKGRLNHVTYTAELTIEQETEIMKIWRATTDALKDEIIQHVCTLLLTSSDILNKDLPKTSKYLHSCIALCWKMCVKDKPMYLDTDAERDDGCEKMFNLDKFKAYTQSGKRVAFVVWPALYLHEGGSLMTKGVAQGCVESNNRNMSE